MEHNQLILIAFGVVAFVALGYMIYRQMGPSKDTDDSSEISSDDGDVDEGTVESNSYYDDSEVYSD